MRSAVSASPLRAPWVEMKYSRTDRPSRKFDLIGRGMISPRGLATRPRMPAIWRTCITLPRAPDPTIMSTGLNFSADELGFHRPADLVGRLGPDLDFLLAPLVVGEDAAVVLLLDLLGLAFELLEQRGLLGRGPHVGDRDGEPGTGRELEAQVLQVVEGPGDLGPRVPVDDVADDLGEVTLLQRPGRRTGSPAGARR